jgi:hypothetical protein
VERHRASHRLVAGSEIRLFKRCARVHVISARICYRLSLRLVESESSR